MASVSNNNRANAGTRHQGASRQARETLFDDKSTLQPNDNMIPSKLAKPKRRTQTHDKRNQHWLMQQIVAQTPATQASQKLH